MKRERIIRWIIRVCRTILLLTERTPIMETDYDKAVADMKSALAALVKANSANQRREEMRVNGLFADADRAVEAFNKASDDQGEADFEDARQTAAENKPPVAEPDLPVGKTAFAAPVRTGPDFGGSYGGSSDTHVDT